MYMEECMWISVTECKHKKPIQVYNIFLILIFFPATTVYHILPIALL